MIILNGKQILIILKNGKKGETGFPVVDAGMRELNKTGYVIIDVD